MIQKALLLSLLLLLNSCSLDSLIALGEVDKVQVVKKNASLAHYRAYFTRTQLKPIKNNQKYLYFYNKKKKDLAVLLHRYNHYILYSLYHPKQPHIIIDAKTDTSYRYIKKILKHKGYQERSPASVYALSKVGLRRYKGIKTLLIEIKDYSALQKKYKTAIRTYNAKKIASIHTKLPPFFIDSYYKTYAEKASTEAQKKQLHIIAKKLNLHQKETKHPDEEKQVQEALAQEKPLQEKTSMHSTALPFHYYAHEASYHELDSYLAKKETKELLSFKQYTQLKQRHATLYEAHILKEGTLEELISRYKVNKKPIYKKRILELMKQVQEQS